MRAVIIHTDGSCEGNPGPGGWASVLSCNGHRKELSGGEQATTNNRMELRAAIEALHALKEACVVELFTDSEYLRNGITEWLPRWKALGWRTAEKKPVKNEDLWRELDRESTQHRVRWRWVKAHNGDTENERCDCLAKEAIRRIRQTHTPAQLQASLTEFQQRQAPVEQGRLL